MKLVRETAAVTTEMDLRTAQVTVPGIAAIWMSVTIRGCSLGAMPEPEITPETDPVMEPETTELYLRTIPGMDPENARKMI